MGSLKSRSPFYILPMKQKTRTQVELIFAAGTLPSFARLFSKGVIVPSEVGCSIESLLCRQFGIEEAYLEQRIQTIFLNGKPVDDYQNIPITNGDILALSAAMPGLAGATLRRGGFYAAMRGAITHQHDMDETVASQGRVILKLFNLLVPEIGPKLLNYGIQIDAAAFHELRKDYRNSIQRGCQQVTWDGKPLSLDDLVRNIDQTESIFLRIFEASNQGGNH